MKNSKFSGLNFYSLEKLSKDEQKKIVDGYGGGTSGGGTCASKVCTRYDIYGNPTNYTSSCSATIGTNSKCIYTCGATYGGSECY